MVQGGGQKQEKRVEEMAKEENEGLLSRKVKRA